MKTSAAVAVEPREALIPALFRSWDRFWFSPTAPTVLGLIRILCGVVTLYVHLAYTTDLPQFFGADAWVDQQTIQEFRQKFNWYTEPSDWDYQKQREPYAQGYYSWSIWYSVTDPGWRLTVHLTILAIMFLFTIGFCTRITSVLSWLAALSYIQRSPTTLFGMDTMMNLLLLYLAIGPSGAALSVDRLVARYWATWRALRSGKPAPPLQPRPTVSANLALRLIQINLCIIYLVSGLSKLEGGTWWSGTAIWWTLANPEFSPIHLAPFTHFLTFLCRHRLLWEVVISGGVLFTFFVEIGFLFLVWNPRLRWVMIGAAIAMHSGIALSMGLTTFSLMMMAMVCSFMPTEAVQQMLARLGRNAQSLRLILNGRARGQVRAASVARAVDVCDQVELEVSQRQRTQAGDAAALARPVPTQTLVPSRTRTLPADPQHLHLVTEAGVVYTGYALFERLVRSLPLLWPVALFTWVPGVAALGKAWFPETQPAHALPADPGSEQHAAKEETATR